MALIPSFCGGSERVSGDRQLKLDKTSHTRNGIVDFLAKLARSNHLTIVWFQDVPGYVAVVLATDCNLVLT